MQNFVITYVIYTSSSPSRSHVAAHPTSSVNRQKIPSRHSVFPRLPHITTGVFRDCLSISFFHFVLSFILFLSIFFHSVLLELDFVMIDGELGPQASVRQCEMFIR